TGPRNGYADGGYLSTDGYASIFDSFKFHLIQVSVPAGASVAAINRHLTSAIAAAVPDAAGYSLHSPDTPQEVFEIEDVRWLPIILGIFLAVLAVAAVGHALATAVRRRARDVAILRALGMTQRQSRLVVVTQATLLAAIGIVIGVPLGLALGRSVWRAVAHSTPIAYVPPLSALALALIVPAALVIANLLAAWPGRRAARLQIAAILRAE
ncbi:MAG: putative transport system permease protein, partial [Pseudonocardiales bacterium]|nr:putative transport system permease protein [Pseudonocardiales bacterium]